MTIWKTRLLRLVVTLRRYSGALAVFGFFSGVASFMLVDRQEDFARVIALVMLVSWPWLVLENVLRHWLDVRFRFRLPAPLLRYATQMIHQESLFFVLPFLIIATTWSSGQALFTGLAVCAALVSVLDPVYYKWLAPRRWLYLGYHTFALFVVMLTALPILLEIPTHQSYLYALGTAVLLSFPSVVSLIPSRTRRRGLLLVGLIVALGAIGWMGRFWVPPSTLRLTEIALAVEIDRERRAPEQQLTEITVDRLHRDGLFAYTAIHAPLGLEERIFHVWMLDGVEVERIPLEIQGGREQGYRAWTHKQNFPEVAAGRWRIEVVTEAGQMIGRARFRAVAESPAGR